MSKPDADLEAHRADAIARAETRRRMLERLSEIGMTIAEEMGAWASQGLAFREDPGKSFAAVSRSIRLTLVLQARIDKQILAMRKGDASMGEAPEDSRRSRCGRVRDAVREAIGQPPDDLENARATVDPLRESLTERETYDDLPDLGLEPDWSQWSDEEGLVTDEAQPSDARPSSWRDSPDAARERRRKRAEPASVHRLE